MNSLARALGFGLLTSLAARLPGRVATVIQLILVLIGSLLPLWPLLRGWIELQDLLAYTVLWMALSVGTTLIRLRTLPKQNDTTRFFALHHSVLIGILSLVCGVWAVILLVEAGPTGGWQSLIPSGIGLILASAWSLADGWFVRGGRDVAKLWQVLLPGYLRFIPLLGGTVMGATLIMNGAPESSTRLVAVILVVALTVIDVVLALVSVIVPAHAQQPSAAGRRSGRRSRAEAT